MARFSKSSQGMKLEAGDIVTVFGVKGKVESVIVSPAFKMVEKLTDETTKETIVLAHVLVEVDFTRGAGEAQFLNLSDIGAVYMPDNAIYLDMKGERVALIDA